MGPPAIPRELAERVRLVVFDADGVLTDAGVYVGATASGEPVELQGHTDADNGVAVRPREDHIASASSDTTVRVWSDLSPIAPDAPRLWTLTRY